MQIWEKPRALNETVNTCGHLGADDTERFLQVISTVLVGGSVFLGKGYLLGKY